MTNEGHHSRKHSGKDFRRTGRKREESMRWWWHAPNHQRRHTWTTGIYWAPTLWRPHSINSVPAALLLNPLETMSWWGTSLIGTESPDHTQSKVNWTDLKQILSLWMSFLLHSLFSNVLLQIPQDNPKGHDINDVTMPTVIIANIYWGTSLTR